jgi:signal transduction histidine kinase
VRPATSTRPPIARPTDLAAALAAVARQALGVPMARLATERDTDPVSAPLLAAVRAADGPLAIEDTRAAPPFRGSVVVEGVRIMACAAVPVRDAHGTIVATFCALDGVPRWWSEQDLALLSTLAIALELVPAGAAARVETTPEATSAVSNPSVGSDAIGQLAGGIAHDFNNQLTVIAANAELLRQSLDELAGTPATREQARREVHEIERAARVAAEMIWQLLAYGRRLPLAPEELDLHARLALLEPRLRGALPTTVHLELAFGAPRPAVRMDPAMLEHVLLELVDNASRAMPAGGRLRVATERVTRDAPLTATPDDVPAGDWIVLSFEDSGVGVPADQLAHLFEPFFTTRDVGHGRGLGLAALHGIVGQSGGRCTVTSATRRGTSVRLWLPFVRALA